MTEEKQKPSVLEGMWRTTKRVTFAFLVVSVTATYLFRAELLEEAKAYLSNAWDLVQVIEVPKDYTEIDLLTLVKEVSRTYGMPHLLTLAIIRQESGATMRHDRMRFEPHLLSRFRRQAWENDIEHQAKATSFGLMQVVYGLHKERCHLKSYADLFNPEINIKCGITVFRDCFERQKSAEKIARIKGALTCYNGGKTYADEVLGKLGELTLEEII